MITFSVARQKLRRVTVCPIGTENPLLSFGLYSYTDQLKPQETQAALIHPKIFNYIWL